MIAKLVLILLILPPGLPLPGQGTPSHEPDIRSHASCPLCGMDRGKFAHSRIFIEYNDGASAGFCSIHCAAAAMAYEVGRTPEQIRVGDYSTRRLIDAESAHWVLDKTKPGVMTGRAKWAFAAKQSASSYIEKNGGEMATFEQALKASYEDMYDDLKMIRDKRRTKGQMK